MKCGFPMLLTKTKIRGGHYELKREDGYVVEAVKGSFGWWFNGIPSSSTLSGKIYDMKHGFTARDQVV